MPATVNDVRGKIQAAEMILGGSGSGTVPCVSSRAEAASVELANRAILDCLKALAEALKDVERRTRA